MRYEALQTIRLAVPIIIGELAQMALHIIDAAMVGALGYKQLAAAALVLQATNIPFVIGIGMTVSVSQMVSLAHGKEDGKAVAHYFFNGFCLCGITAGLISLLLFTGSGLLRYLGQDPEVVLLALPFLKIMALSMIPVLLFITLKQFADGLQYTRTAMTLSLLSVPLNVFLAWLLIYGHWGFPRLELVGAGYATLITRSLAFLFLAVVVLRHKTFRPFTMTHKSQWVVRKTTVRELLGIGIPSALQIGMEAGAFAVSGIIIGTLGAVSGAAHQIALSCASFTFMVSMGLGQAGSIRVSNTYGTANWKKISVIGKSTLLTALVYGLFCAVMFVVFRTGLPGFFTSNRSVYDMAVLLLLLAAVFQISDATQAIGAGLLRGIKDVKTPTVLIGLAYWVIGIPVGYLLAFKGGMGAGGMWVGFILGLTFAAVFLIVRFLKITRRMSGASKEQNRFGKRRGGALFP